MTTNDELLTMFTRLFRMAYEYDCEDSFFVSYKTGEPEFFAKCSDVFFWGTADLEQICNLEDMDLLEQSFKDIKAVPYEKLSWDMFGPELYCARKRGQRPQGACYPKPDMKGAAEMAALYDACGPFRETGFGNPKPRPNYLHAVTEGP